MNNLRESSKQFDFKTQLSNQGASFNSFIMGSGKYLAFTLVRAEVSCPRESFVGVCSVLSSSPQENENKIIITYECNTSCTFNQVP